MIKKEIRSEIMEKYIVFDIGGSAIKYGLIDESGEILSNDKVKTPNSWEEMAEEFDKVVSEHREEISGVAVSAPGRIDVNEGIIYLGGALPYLHEVNIKKHFRDNFDLPATVVNDGKAAAQAELWVGNLKGVDHAAAIALGTGIGGAVVVDGKVQQGRNFVAGEFSSVLPTEEPLHNNLAVTNSSVKLVAELAEILGLPDKADGEGVFEFVTSRENEEVNENFAAYCKRLAVFMCNLQVILDISHVVIGGGISNQPVLIEELNNQYDIIREKQPAFKETFLPLNILPCKYSNNANLLGALYQLLLTEGKLN